MFYTTILCTTDGLEHSDRAVRHAGALAKESSGDLHIVQIDDKPFASTGPAGEGFLPTRAERRARVRSQIEALAREEQLEVTPHFLPDRRGPVADQLAEVADELDADLIVVGSGGRAPLSAALGGSVAQRLPHVTDRPVLVLSGVSPRRRAQRRWRVPPRLPAAAEREMRTRVPA